MNNLITVVAVADGNPTANVVYSQVMRGVPSDNVFTVTATGVVNVVGVIDRESERTYDVQIQVRELHHIKYLSSRHEKLKNIKRSIVGRLLIC